MSDSYINVKGIDNTKVKDAILEILKAKADQISNYADFVSRHMQHSGVLMSTLSKVEWKGDSIEITIQLEITAVKKEKIPDLEARTIRFQRWKDVDTDSYEDFNNENENIK